MGGPTGACNPTHIMPPSRLWAGLWRPNPEISAQDGPGCNQTVESGSAQVRQATRPAVAGFGKPQLPQATHGTCGG